MVRLLLLVLMLSSISCKKTTNDTPSAPAPPPPRVAQAVDASSGIVAQARIGGDPDAKQPGLPLVIEAVHEHEQPTKKAPWHGPGGTWTYLDLKTPAGAKFVVGVLKTRSIGGDMPMTMYDVQVVASDPEHGAKLVDELAEAFHVKAPPPVAEKARKALTPLTIGAISLGENIGRDPSGSFSGSGDWIATKWTSERGDHAAEVFFNYSIARKLAELSEKDSDYNSDIVADLALALRDGLGTAK